MIKALEYGKIFKMNVDRMFEFHKNLIVLNPIVE